MTVRLFWLAAAALCWTTAIAQAFVFDSAGCQPFDPNGTGPKSSSSEDRAVYQLNQAIYAELQAAYNAAPERGRYVHLAMQLIKQCSIRRMDDGSVKDLEQFRSRCKKPFSAQEAASLHEEFEAHFVIVKTLRKMLLSEVPNPDDDLLDYRTRQIRYGLRVHEAIARSMELLPLPLKLAPGLPFLFVVLLSLLVALLIAFASVGAVTALVEREPQRIQDGVVRLHRLWNRAKVTVFQAEWDKNKISIRTIPPTTKPTIR